MRKETLFEAFGEISSRTVQLNTLKKYRQRIRAAYIRWATLAAAIIAVGTGLYVFRTADLTHRVNEGISGGSGMTTADRGEVEVEAAEPVTEQPAGEVTEAIPGGAYVSGDAGSYATAESSKETAYAEDIYERSEDAYIDFGLEIKLPDNPGWIKETSRTGNQNEIKVVFKDFIAEADCILYGVNSDAVALPESKLHVSFDDSLDETWEGADPDGKTRYLKVRHSADKKIVLITWDYNKYKFEIIGEFTGGGRDASPIAKAALHILAKLKPVSPGNRGVSDIPSHTEDAPADLDGPYREAQPYPKDIEALQAAISQGMADKELPFVISSSICENPLRIEVTVNTKDEALINKIKAYDKTGNMIKIKYSQNPIVDLDLNILE